ncbi:MAG: cell envelope integrity protein CreD [Crocinitomicaceae bacterium]|nr:cell envelope integrity protein CreD [Crocinitomicaceae bacterium]
MKALFQNVFFKMGMIMVLIIILLIPAIMVQDLIRERMVRQDEAVFEVSSKHATSQSVTGPVLTVPYTTLRQLERTDGTTYEVKDETKYYHILPENLEINGEITPEKRKRGLFEVVVYGSDLKIEGHFAMAEFLEQGIPYESLDLDKAFITVGISDLKGVTDQVKINVDGESFMCNPGLLSTDVVNSGLHIRYPMDTVPEQMDFNFDLSLNGSENIMFTPIGKVTQVNLVSNWSEPSFDGNFLPESRVVNDDGFTASWKVLHLNRNYPQGWVGDQHYVDDSNFGVNLRLPVDVYQKSMRVAKYAILFIVLTYLVFFFVEILNQILIHPIQYILVGIALVLFYVLLLAFSEQIYFDLAYMISAGMTISLILFYCRSILKSWGLAMMTASILLILYGFIFIIIQMQDWALLFGSLGVFLILAVTMYFSRRVDWFELKGMKTDLKTEELQE